MKRSEAKRKLEEIRNTQEVENVASNLNRARSITVGTCFGGTTEVMMRSDGGRHLWCVMQPVEVIELIHQLAANVGCDAALTPRKDFATWRDWRVSEAEKKHLQGHAPFVNDMAVFQKLGASGFNEAEANKIMDILASQTKFINEDDESEILNWEKRYNGASAHMIGKEDDLLHNKLVMEKGDVVYMAGGTGGHETDEEFERNLNKAAFAEQSKRALKNEHTMATKKAVNRRKSKRASASS